jgi:hypothetical protein
MTEPVSSNNFVTSPIQTENNSLTTRAVIPMNLYIHGKWVVYNTDDRLILTTGPPSPFSEFIMGFILLSRYSSSKC